MARERGGKERKIPTHRRRRCRRRSCSTTRKAPKSSMSLLSECAGLLLLPFARQLCSNRRPPSTGLSGQTPDRQQHKRAKSSLQYSRTRTQTHKQRIPRSRHQAIAVWRHKAFHGIPLVPRCRGFTIAAGPRLWWQWSHWQWLVCFNRPGRPPSRPALGRSRFSARQTLNIFTPYSRYVGQICPDLGPSNLLLSLLSLSMLSFPGLRTITTCYKLIQGP